MCRLIIMKEEGMIRKRIFPVLNIVMEWFCDASCFAIHVNNAWDLSIVMDSVMVEDSVRDHVCGIGVEFAAVFLCDDCRWIGLIGLIGNCLRLG